MIGSSREMIYALFGGWQHQRPLVVVVVVEVMMVAPSS
jgi:hypothetical protein